MVQIELTEGAIKNGYLTIPSGCDLFDDENYGGSTDDDIGKLFRLELPNNTTIQTDIRKSGNGGRIRKRVGSLFRELNVKQGMTAVIEKISESIYRLSIENNAGVRVMDDYFTKEHFDLLEKYGGEKYDSDNDEHKLARDKLKNAYEITNKWAVQSKKRLFPDGTVRIRRDPLIRGQYFEKYNWAKIYPHQKALEIEKLAYTVGIESDEGVRQLIIKIDTVNLRNTDDPLEKQYQELRGQDETSKLIYRLSDEEGLEMGFDQLVDWTVEKIKLLQPYFKELSDGLYNTLEPFIEESIMKNSNPLNQILYGPPGTGKTYHTINKALSILDPDFLKSHSEREDLKERFDVLKQEGRIGFVTFHQSFSYEDFVEGLRAEENDGNLSYDVEPGVFKRLCKRATKNSNNIDGAIEKLKELTSEESVLMTTSRGNKFYVTYRGRTTFIIEPLETESEVLHRANIDYIKQFYYGQLQKPFYNSSYVQGILEYLIKEYGLTSEKPELNNSEPVVLIIDEINRGNTASIFGELITLIETSKRAGNEEALSVILPYSKEPFHVPNNLYIIGTMNTADRSLALLDTALRRRFEFEFMGPDIEVLSGIGVEGIDIPFMLETMNKRIELLYDKDHTIGHSFFMELRDDNSITKLATIFERHILPLLEEYFFEDWSKIQQVLGDHLKSNEELKFIVSAFNDDNEVAKLLGDDMAEVLGEKVFRRNDDALYDVNAYIGIYQRS